MMQHLMRSLPPGGGMFPFHALPFQPVRPLLHDLFASSASKWHYHRNYLISCHMTDLKVKQAM
jgi:hypothetical protein